MPVPITACLVLVYIFGALKPGLLPHAMMSAMRLALFLTVAWSVMLLMHLVVYLAIQRVYGVDVPYGYVYVGVLATLYFIVSVFTRRFQGALVRALYAVAATWVGVVWLMFSVTVAYEVARTLLGGDAPLLYSALLLGAACASVYALINGSRLHVKEYTLAVPHLTAPLRIAHLSDIHVGTMHREAFLRRVVTLTNSTTPDVVLITGDLFDGSAPINESILRPLNELSAPTYFSTGNHEGYKGMDHVRSTLAHLSMTFLENAVAEFRGVRIVGVNDRQILPRTTTLDAVLTSLGVQDDGTPTILLYHTPVEWQSARAHGVALMLSGHIHNGQIFPFALLVRLFFRQVCGLYEKEGLFLHVSPGTGTGGPPMRLGSRCQVTVLNVVPVSDR